MKIGDILICHNPCIMNCSRNKTTTINITYIIEGLGIDNSFHIKDDLGLKHNFSHSYYKKWFYSLNDVRYQKLKKLNKIK